MRPFRFIHAADLHLDSPFTGLAADAPEIRDKLREATFDALRRIVTLALERRVDFVVIAGDVFDAADKSLRAQIRLRDELARLSRMGIHIFIAYGNHDHLQGWRASLSWPPEVHFFGADRVQRIPVTIDGATLADVYGISHGGAGVKDNLARLFRKEGDYFAVGVLHANVEGNTGHEDYPPCSIEDLKSGGMDYWALGHVHARQELDAAGVCAAYPGNPQGRNPKESGAKGCYFVAVDGSGNVRREFVPTDCIRWVVSDFDIGGLTTLQEVEDGLKATLDECLSDAGGRPVIGRIRLVGRGQVHTELSAGDAISGLCQTLREYGMMSHPFAWVESIIQSTRREIDRESLKASDSFVSVFISLIDRARVDNALRQALLGELHVLLRPEVRETLPEVGEELFDEWLEAAESKGIDLLLEEDIAR